MSDLNVSHNPYLQSRALWNDMYGSIQNKLQNAYRIIFIFAVVVVILALGLVMISGRSQIKPYLAVLKGNEILTVNEFTSPDFKPLQTKLAVILAEQFLVNSRALSSDSDVNQTNRIKALSVVSNEATRILKDYFNAEVSSNVTRQVLIHTVLIKASNTLDLRWQEVLRDKQSGELLSQQDYSAQISFIFDGDHLSEQQRVFNPLGFYITHLAWAKDLDIKESYNGMV